MRYSFLIFLWVSTTSLAQEFRGGHIWFTRINQYNFDAVVDVYYKNIGALARPGLRVQCNFNPVDTALLQHVDTLPDSLYRLQYKTRVTISEEGAFNFVTVLDTFPLPALKNLSGTGSDHFFIQAPLYPPIAQFFGNNSPPVFSNPPGAFVFENGVLLFSAEATDPDGDQLYYRLINYSNSPYYEYSLPVASNFFECNFMDGMLTWDKPLEAGKYLVGIEAESFKPGGISVGKSWEHLLFEIRETDLATKSNSPETDKFACTVTPNPVHGQLRLELHFPGDISGPCTVNVWDLTGQSIYHSEIPVSGNGLSQEIETVSWPPGLYGVSLHLGGSVWVKKVMIQ